jgi:transforming growth factor-beta-induced protein
MSYQDQTTVNQGTGTDDTLRTAHIFDTAAKLPEISRFVEAIRAAGLQASLQTPDLKTLFAPTNEAIGAAQETFWSDLMKAENRERLANVVGRHIVIGRQTSADLKTASTLRTLAGDPVTVEMDNRTPLFGGARLVKLDVPCVNGHLHVIDRLVVREYTYSS